MTTADAIRNNATSDQLKHLDYKDMVIVRAGKVERTYSTNPKKCRDVYRASPEDQPISMAKLLRLELVDPVAPGGKYSLNTAGDAALNEWLANRPTYPTPTEGPSSDLR